MNEKRRIRVSKFVSKYLRHEPEALGLTLAPGGWVAVDDLLAGAARAGFPFTREELEHVLRTCAKQRFALDETGTRIRANQGHTAEVDLGLEPAEPPAELYHGTARRNLEAILREGLRRMARHHVHLSGDAATAAAVGSRHGSPVVLVCDSGRMRAGGHVFFRSANGVWLVEAVPAPYLRLLTPET